MTNVQKHKAFRQTCILTLFGNVCCLQEQYAKVNAAHASADDATLLSAKFMFLATATLADTDEVVAAGIFYPRVCSKDNVEMPHMYVELLCCNHPGRGYGTILLQHIEQFTASCCDQLSAGFFGFVAAEQSDLHNPYVSSAETACNAAPAATATNSRMITVLPLVALGASIPAGGSASICCTACSTDSSNVSTASAVVAICDNSMGPQLMQAMQVAGRTDDLASTASSLSRAAASQHLSSQDDEAKAAEIPVLILADAKCASPTVGSFNSNSNSSMSPSHKINDSVCSPAKRIRGIKLLSVASAQSFYERNGYGAPDVCKEMFKPLTCCCKKTVGLGDADSVAGSSCSSIAMNLG